MNNYQIYEEVGRGRNSTVYKGRRKRSIEYYAVASIDKSQRQRVLNSVHFLRSMSHENVLKFTNWYETTNHLWVISEYCIGGSLKTLLELERGLPERCAKTFGFDLVKGLSYIHSRGVLYTDVKPSNILMDDCAMLRFYDFGLAQSVETAAKGVRVGTPAYMAPELFSEGGLHSYASDLWALGCVLHELATGHPPFVDAKLQNLMHKIVNDPVPRVEHYSSTFNELIEGLLQKDPLQRATWADVFASEFWSGVNLDHLEPPVLPPQPAFEAFKKARAEAAKTAPRELVAEKLSKDVLRASINAERNLARELKDRGGYGAAAQQTLGVDREVDFSEPTADDQTEASDRDGAPLNSSLGKEPSADNLRENPPMSVAPEIVSAAPGHSPGLTSAGTPSGAGPRASVRASLRIAPTGAKLPETVDPGSVEVLLAHPSDTQVKSIIMNSRVERFGEPRFEPQELPFPARTVAQLKAMDPKELDFFLQGVYAALSGASSTQDKANTLSYFASLCSDFTMANVFINSSVAGLCVKLLNAQSTPTNLCVLLATTLGVLLRHANLILPDVQKTGVLPALAVASRTQVVKVRRRAMGCLGELLFYIAAQGAAEVLQWTVPPEAVNAVIDGLRDEDEITRHYAVKTVENIALAGTAPEPSGASVNRLTNPTVMAALLDTFTASPNVIKSEHLRASALNSALRLAAIDESLIPGLISALPPAVYFADVLISNSARAVQSLLTFLNFVLARLIGALLSDRSCSEQHLAHAVQWAAPPTSTLNTFAASSPSSVATYRQLIADCVSVPEKMIQGLATAMEHSNVALRGKATLTALMLTVVTGSFLGQACEYRLMSHIEKLAYDKETYARQCVCMWQRLLERYVVGTMRQLASVVKGTAAALAKELKLVLYVVTPPTLKSFVLQDGELYTAAGAGLAALATASGLESDEYHRAFFLLLEALGQDVNSMVTHHAKVVSKVLPALVTLLQAPDGSIRFSAVKLLHDWLSVLVSKPQLYNAAAPQAGAFAGISAIGNSLLPLLQPLLADGDPIPLYALKIITVLGDRNTVYMSRVANAEITTTLLQFIRIGHSNSTVFSVRALLRVLQCGDEALMALAVAQGLVPRVSEILRAALDDTTMDGFLDPVMETALFALCAAQRGTVPAITTACSEWGAQLTKLFLPPCATRHTSAECAASCIGMLLALYPNARSQLALPEARKLLRDAFTSVDEPSSHIALPLAQALLTAVEMSPPALAVELTKDEVLFLSLEEAAEYTNAFNQDCATAVRQLLSKMHAVKNSADAK